MSKKPLTPLPECPDCLAACMRMKAQGFRNWRDHACYEHAAVDWDALCAENGWTFDQPEAAA